MKGNNFKIWDWIGGWDEEDVITPFLLYLQDKKGREKGIEDGPIKTVYEDKNMVIAYKGSRNEIEKQINNFVSVLTQIDGYLLDEGFYEDSVIFPKVAKDVADTLGIDNKFFEIKFSKSFIEKIEKYMKSNGEEAYYKFLKIIFSDLANDKNKTFSYLVGKKDDKVYIVVTPYRGEKSYIRRLEITEIENGRGIEAKYIEKIDDEEEIMEYLKKAKEKISAGLELVKYKRRGSKIVKSFKTYLERMSK